jgi:hypothetical protein
MLYTGATLIAMLDPTMKIHAERDETTRPTTYARGAAGYAQIMGAMGGADIAMGEG